MKIVGLLLAAGRSSRFGEQNKLRLPYGTSTVIETALTNLSNSNVDECIVITGFAAEELESSLSSYKSDRVKFVHNEKYNDGRASSIQKAIETIRDSSDAALFMVADKPGVTTSEINSVLEQFKKRDCSLAYMMTPQGRGHPIMFSGKLFDELLNLSGDVVGEELVSKYANDTIVVDSDVEQIDIDSPRDYERALEQLATEQLATRRVRP